VPLTRARALCFPAYDVGFARVVEAILTEDPGITADALQTRLRNLAPATIVHTRELSGERDQTLYVFRDGRWAGRVQSEWWQEKGVARVTVSIQTGSVIDADRALLDLIGAEREWVIGRMYHEFVVPQARIASDALYRTALETGHVHSVARVVGPNGRGVTVEFRAEVIGDQMVIAVRAAFLAQGPERQG
jgi:PAS domain S-box-containing protein